MNQELKMVAEFHRKFKAPIANTPSLISKDRSDLRYSMTKEEIEEYKLGVEEKDLENITKELTDILYATYGTILEHGLQDKMEEIFAEVHKSNMSKDYSTHKMIKGENYFKPNLKKFFS